MCVSFSNLDLHVSDIKMKVGFLFPNNEAARYAAARLIETKFDVEFFCPEKIDLDAASCIISELNILSWEQTLLRNEDNAFRKSIKIYP